jgi:NADPH:quinone reductase-like Zn-dependent oxidoreductase
MRAAVCRAYGPPESIDFGEVSRPVLAAGQVRVRVTAAAVNYPDVLLMAGKYQVTLDVPFVPGSEFAGVVSELADGVDGLAVGDRVMGSAMCGAFASEIAVPARSLSPVPSSVSDAHAAAFGVAHRTAYYALRSLADVQPGERVVVLGAGGGVGLAAVQLATVLGASVTAVASSAAKLSVASSYGASVLINHREADLRQALREAHGDGVDVVVDPVGGDLAEPALRALRWGGRFLTLGYASGTVPRIPLNLVLLKGCRILGFQLRSFAASAPDEVARNEAELRELLGSGLVFPHIGATFPLAETAAALRHVADGKAIGKVVLDIGAGVRIMGPCQTP